MEWFVRVSNALPEVMAQRERCNPHSDAYVHWSECLGHLRFIIEDPGMTNIEAKRYMLMAHRSALRALRLITPVR